MSFQGFANVWSPALLSKQVKQKPVSLWLGGERLVMFRGRDGQVATLFDRCPHRGVRLSLGRVTETGCLECPFHAWQFDGAGQATHVPLNPDAKRERLFARALPTREINGLIWVYTAAVAQAPSEPVVPDSLARTDLARTYLQTEWHAHWTRAMENMLDSPHVPFVHRKTIGRFTRRYLKADSRMEIEWHDTPYGGRTTARLDDREEAAWLDFYKPNMMVLNIPIPNQVFRMHAICVPMTADSVRMIVVGSRSFATSRLLNPFFALSNRRIVNEDRAVVESSYPLEIPPAAEELSVRTDRATLQFRKYYFETLRSSVAA